MVRLKTGVVLIGNKYIEAISEAVQTVFDRRGWDVLISSGLEDTHSQTSYHPQGRALDISFWVVPADLRLEVAGQIRALLPTYYDVVVESDHYHIEADARKELAQEARRQV